MAGMDVNILKQLEGMLNKLNHAVRKKSLYASLANTDFIPFIQPIFQDDNMVGCEVLMRLKKNGIISSPVKYIQEMELDNVINDATCVLLEQVKADFSPHVGKLPDNFYFSFNICAQQLKSVQMVNSVIEFNALFKNKVTVVLEIVERGTIYFDDFSLAVIDRLVDEGIRFSIDDFGSASSGLKYIERPGFTTIKIDKDLTLSEHGSLIYPSVITAITAISSKLNIQIIAEGVENEEQLHLLKNKGINHFQGFLFSRPMSTSSFINDYLCHPLPKYRYS